MKNKFLNKGKRFIAFFLCLVFVSNLTFAQNSKLSLNLTNKSLVEIFQEIQKKSGFDFFYKESDKLNNFKTSIKVENEEVAPILTKILENSGFSFKIVDTDIVITELKELDITGKITDKSGIALPGVSVVIKGTNKGTVSDIDGKYTITKPATSNKIEFSFMGMKTVLMNVNNKTEIDVVMEDNSVGLDEVVVVGYGTQKKVNLTGSITSVRVDELSEIPATSLSNTLAGRAPGVTIVGNSGLSGSTSSIRIRGSFGEPLYIIDGITSSKSDFDALEQNEIENLSFLKDAASASIYGSKAGNGVILVTTKKGKKQKPMFTYQSSYTFYRPTQDLLSDLTTATDELIYQNRVAEFRGIELPNGEREFNYFKDKNYNVHDLIWQNPMLKKHSLSVSGGNDDIRYFSLISYKGEEGSYKNLENENFNLRSNVTAKITDFIEMNLNISANQQNSKRFYWPFSGDDEQTVADLYRVTFNWPKTMPFYTDKDGNPMNHITDYPVQTPIGSWKSWNVVDQIVGDRYLKTRERKFNSILEFKVDLGMFVEGLSTKFKGNYTGSDYSRKKYLTFQRNYEFIRAEPDGNRFIPGAPDPNKIAVFNYKYPYEYLQYNLNSQWKYQINWFLNYQNSFGKNNIDAVFVFEQAENGGEGNYVKLEDPLTNHDQSFVYSTDTEKRNGNAWEYQGARQSYIGRLNYNYAEKYIAEFSFRYDGNTKFAKDDRWGFFPSGSLAWRISEESFMKWTKAYLSNLKLRASYGTTGSDGDVGAFKYQSNYKNAGSYMFGDNLYKAIKPGDIPNPNITWYTQKNYNAGIDFGFLGNKLTGEFDVFYKKETDILGSRIVTLPDTFGTGLAPENYGERSWRGGELTLQWQDKIMDEIEYGVHANLGFSKDQWDVWDESEVYQEGGNLHWASRIGQPNNRIFGYKAKGIIRTQEKLDELLAAGYKTHGRDPYLGAIFYEDIRGDGYDPTPDGIINGNDRTLLSDDATPRINYGFGFNVGWKGLRMDAHFQGVGNYDRMISNKEGAGMRQHGGTVRPYYPIWADDVWTPENTGGKYPRPIGNNWTESGASGSSFWIRSGAYVRLKNLNLSYSLPKKIVDVVNIAGVKFFVNATNLFVISDMTEFHDPEQDHYDSYPLMKTYTVGLEVKF
jgi:TonB-linked SusC/RagA family outer membrane protein